MSHSIRLTQLMNNEIESKKIYNLIQLNLCELRCKEISVIEVKSIDKQKALRDYPIHLFFTMLFVYWILYFVMLENDKWKSCYLIYFEVFNVFI